MITTYFIPKMNGNYEQDFGDDFYEIETFINDKEVIHDLDEWPSYATPNAAIETANYLALTGKWTSVRVTVHGCCYADKSHVQSNTIIWDSNVIIIGCF